MIRNKSATYLLPFVTSSSSMVLQDYISKEIFPTNLFINTFMYYENDLENGFLYLVYKRIHEPVVYYPTIENRLFINNPNFVCKIENDLHSIYKMKVNNELHFTKFKNGGYSRFDKEDKKRILNFLGLSNDGDSKIKGVLYKDEKVRKQLESDIGMKLDPDSELSSIPDIDSETYNLERFLQQVSKETSNK